MWLLCAGLKQMCSVLQVVCFEGNAGFYEMGCSGTPIECGYSAGLKQMCSVLQVVCFEGNAGFYAVSYTHLTLPTSVAV